MAKQTEKPHESAKTLKHRPFHHRLLRAFGLALGLIGFSLTLGVAGYHFIAGLRWVDALLDAAMILSGMGPVTTLTTNAGKIFAAGYALFSGLMLIGATGIVLSPVFHRVLHRFHIEERGDQ